MWGRCRVDVFVNGKENLKNEEEEKEGIKNELRPDVRLLRVSE